MLRVGGMMLHGEDGGGGLLNANWTHYNSPMLKTNAHMGVGTSPHSNFFGVGLLKQLNEGRHVFGELAVNGAEGFGLRGEAMHPFSSHTKGYLRWGVNARESHVQSEIEHEKENYSVTSSMQLGDHEMFVEVKVQAKLSEEVKLFAKARVGVGDSSLAVGGTRQVIDENNSVACQLMMGTTSGLSLKVKYVQMNQVYVLPIKLSDEFVPEVASLGLIVPMLGYYALKRIVIDPYIQSHAAKQRQLDRKRYRMDVEQRRAEAQQSVQLMAETVDRKIK
jgi:DnaJ family protein C protein 11